MSVLSSLELLLDESKLTTLRVVPDIAADNRVDNQGGIHKDGESEQT